MNLRLIFVGALFLICSKILSQSPVLQKNWWFPNNSVSAIALDTAEGKVYLGGDFDVVGPYQPYGAVFKISDSTLLPGQYSPDSSVVCSIADGNGGWFVSGYFKKYGDSTRNGLVHLDGSGKILSDLRNGVNGIVKVLYLQDSILYFGGEFDKILGAFRKNLAAYNLNSNKLTSFNLSPDAMVHCIHISNDKMYIGGDFTSINGNTRFRLACIDLKTNGVTAWKPAADATVSALRVYDKRIYIAGNFRQINGVNSGQFTIIDSNGINTTNGAIYIPTNGTYPIEINAMKIKNNQLFLCGSFYFYYNSIKHQNIFAYDLVNSKVMSWAPIINNGIHTIDFLPDGKLIIGGDFITVNNVKCARIATLDSTSGNITDVPHHIGARVNSISISGNSIFCGGEFLSAGGVMRPNLARMDLNTGKPDFWNPQPSSIVSKILVLEDRIILNGSFYKINNKSTGSLVAIHKSTIDLFNWKPSCSGINDIEYLDSRIYLGGDFSAVTSEPRDNIASIDTTYGYTYSWNPGADFRVNCLLGLNGKMIVGGDFDYVNGIKRPGLAVLDPFQNKPVNTNFPIYAVSIREIHVINNSIYVGGHLSNFIPGSGTQDFAASIDTTTLNVRNTWNPKIENGEVVAFSDLSGSIALSGYFSKVASVTRKYLALVNSTNGALLPWNPNPDDYVQELTGNNKYLFCGGSFKKISGSLRQGLAVYYDTCPGIIYDTLKLHGCDAIQYKNVTYKRDTVFTNFEPNTAGCGTMLTCQFDIGHSSVVSLTLNGCDRVMYLGKPITKSGLYFYQFKSHDNCDSSVNLTVKLTAPNTNIFVDTDNSLNSYAQNAQFQWFNCDSSYQIIPGETKKKFIPTKTGNYGVLVTENNCTDTSLCYSIYINGIRDLQLQNKFRLFPNPASEKITIEPVNHLLIQSIELRNEIGRKIQVLSNKQDSRWILDVESLPAGVYFVTIRTAETNYEIPWIHR
ncbi:MAG: T9SS type A sorting domain-containing protein [Bacteroidetes bacterium]|nr:T9SS type A sorting domain-containing protein [Bacteroidota bacterium]